MGMAQCQGFIDGVVVDRVTGGPPDPYVVPRRFGIPLIGEIHPIGGGTDRRADLQAWRAFDFRRELTADRIGDINFIALQRDEARRFVRNDLQHQTFDLRHFPPVTLIGFKYQFDAGREGDEFVRTRADGRFLVGFLSDFFHIGLWYDPAGPGCVPVIGQEVGPWFLEMKAYHARRGNFDGCHPLLHVSMARATVTIEGILHIFGRYRSAVMKFSAVAKYECVPQAIRRHRIILRQTGR